MRVAPGLVLVDVAVADGRLVLSFVEPAALNDRRYGRGAESPGSGHCAGRSDEVDEKSAPVRFATSCLAGLFDRVGLGEVDTLGDLTLNICPPVLRLRQIRARRNSLAGQ